MKTALVILIVIASILLILLVLVQNSKGGGLAQGFSSGNTVLGAPKTTDFLEKATWSLIAFIVLLSIFAVGLGKSSTERVNDAESAIEAEMSSAIDEASQSQTSADFSEQEEQN